MNKKQYKALGFETVQDIEAFMDRDDVKTIIGTNYDHYRELWVSKFDTVVNGAEKKKIKGRFNWLALACFLVWAAYRRIYAMALTLCFMLAALSFVEVYYNIGSNSGLVGGWIVMAFMSKDLYFTHLVALTKKLDKMRDEHEREKFLKWRTGTSKLYACLVVPAFIVITLIALETASQLSGNPW